MATKTQETVDLTDAYTARDVARMLGVKTGTLAGWRANATPNKPPYVTLSKKVVLYPRKQFHAWANRQPLKGGN